MTNSQHVYEVRPRKDHHGVDLLSDALPFGRLWYGKPDAIKLLQPPSAAVLTRSEHFRADKKCIAIHNLRSARLPISREIRTRKQKEADEHQHIWGIKRLFENANGAGLRTG
jgi:hypothetical protein